jgi:DNA-binding PadR family transcriptional regulator
VTRTNQPADLGGARLSEPAVLVLAALAAGAKHGYAIIGDIESQTGQRLGPGTLYGIIARLEARGLIQPLEMEDRGRRPYRITAAGRSALRERVAELASYQSALRRLAGA